MAVIFHHANVAFLGGVGNKGECSNAFANTRWYRERCASISTSSLFITIIVVDEDEVFL
jgi:hypothetical protein